MKPRRPSARRCLKASMIRLTPTPRLGSGRPSAREFLDGLHVLVAPAGEVDDEGLAALHLARELERVGDGVCGFERRDDAFEFREKSEGCERLLVGGRDVRD